MNKDRLDELGEKLHTLMIHTKDHCDSPDEPHAGFIEASTLLDQDLDDESMNQQLQNAMPAFAAAIKEFLDTNLSPAEKKEMFNRSRSSFPNS